MEKKLLLGVLADAMDSLLPEERELAMKVFGEEMSLADYADMKKQNPRTLSDHKRRILSKLRRFFSERVLRSTADDRICQQKYFCDKFYRKCRTVFKKISF